MKNRNTWSEIVEYINNNLNYEEKYELFRKRDEILEDYQTSLKELKDKIDKPNNIAEFIKAFSKATIESLAISTIISLAPTIKLKIAASSLIILKGTYSLSKSCTYKNIIDKETKANKLLHELELTYKENKLIDTRFSPTTIKYINEFLERNNIPIPKSYEELRKTIYSLNIDLKMNLINFLNNLNGNKINTIKEFKGTDETFTNKLKSLIIKPITIGGTLGIGVATTINSIDPSITVGIYNGTIIGSITNTLSNNPNLSIINGALTAVLTKFLQYVPVIGEGLENIIARENIIVTAIIGSVYYLGYNSIKNIYHSIYKIIKNKKFIKKFKEDLKFDELLYGKPKRNINFSESYIINYFNGKGINIENYENLKRSQKRRAKKILKELENKDKTKLNKVLCFIKKILKFLYYTVALCLGSLTIIDLFIKPEFLESLRLQLFPNSYKKYGLINEKVVENVAPQNVSPEPIKVEPIPCPKPNPAPTPAPTPTPNITSATNVLEVPNQITNFLNNPNFINELNTKTGKEIFNALYNLEEYKFIRYSVNKMNMESISRLIEYINETNINNNMTYTFIKDIVNERIISINNYVDLINKYTKAGKIVLGTGNLITETRHKVLRKKI